MILLRAQKRADRQRKKMSAPKGGTRAGQALRLKVQRNHAGLSKALKPRIRIIIKK